MGLPFSGEGYNQTEKSKSHEVLVQELIKDFDVIIGLAKTGRIVHIENVAKAAIAKAKHGID